MNAQPISRPVIQTHNLTKTYKRDRPPALDALDLQVAQGEIFGYLGPNGAGKTTTIRLLLDMIRPNGGSASIFGLDAQRDTLEIHRRVGFLPGELNLWENLTGHEIVRYLSRIRGSVDQTYVKQLSERLALDLATKVRSYSSGNRRKLGLVIALMHRPDLLILDEPTNGLDPLMQQIFHDMMREVRAEGRTVFLSSHILSEVQAICDRVGILRDGRLQAVERVTDLVRVKFNYVTFQFREPIKPEVLAALPGVKDVTAEDSRLRVRLTGDIDPVLRGLGNAYIVNIHTEEPSLEEIFLSYYGEKPLSKRDTAELPSVPTVISADKHTEHTQKEAV